MCQVEEHLWASQAFYLLEPPAFEVVKARVKTSTKEGLWTEQLGAELTDLMIKHFGDVEYNLSLRAKLHRLEVRNGDLLAYMKIFNETADIILRPFQDER
jgi:hypothetical protein